MEDRFTYGLNPEKLGAVSSYLCDQNTAPAEFLLVKSQYHTETGRALSLIHILEQKKLEAENSEIVDIVRGMSISLTELPLLFEKLKDGGTLGQSVPKSEEEKKEEN